MRKIIKAVMDKGKIHFNCPICRAYYAYSTIHYDAFKDYGYDCHRCYTRFTVEFDDVVN